MYVYIYILVLKHSEWMQTAFRFCVLQTNDNKVEFYSIHKIMDSFPLNLLLSVLHECHALLQVIDTRYLNLGFRAEDKGRV